MNHKHLRELAERATAGEWHAETDFIDDDYGTGDSYVASPTTVCDATCVAVCNSINYLANKNNARFIAAANPQTIIALLDEIERLRAMQETSVEDLKDECCDFMYEAICRGVKDEPERLKMLLDYLHTTGRLRTALPEINVDELAQFIRTIDGDNTMGAGELAEHIAHQLKGDNRE